MNSFQTGALRCSLVVTCRQNSLRRERWAFSEYPVSLREGWMGVMCERMVVFGLGDLGNPFATVGSSEGMAPIGSVVFCTPKTN